MKSFVLQREKRNSVSSARVLTIIVIIEITRKHNIASRSQILGWIRGLRRGRSLWSNFVHFREVLG